MASQVPVRGGGVPGLLYRAEAYEEADRFRERKWECSHNHRYVQDAFVRAWRSRDRFEGRAAMRSWLYRIATNVCLDVLKGKERRARPMDLGPSVEPVEANLNVPAEVTWLEPIPLHLIAPEPDPAEAAV